MVVMKRKKAKQGGELESQLRLACNAADLVRIDELLKAGANPNLRCIGFRDLPLQYASSYGNHDVVRALLRGGADPNALNEYGTSPLQYAASGDDADLVDLYVEFGGDIHALDTHGWDCLQRAALSGYPQTVARLIELGAEVNRFEENSRRIAPLAAACTSASNDPECLRLLIKAGANPDHREGDGRTAMHLAAGRGAVDFMEILFEGGAKLDSNPLCKGGMLHESCRADHARATLWLLDKYGLEADVRIGGRTLMQLFSSKPAAKAQIKERLRSLASEEVAVQLQDIMNGGAARILSGSGRGASLSL